MICVDQSPEKANGDYFTRSHNTISAILAHPSRGLVRITRLGDIIPPPGLPLGKGELEGVRRYQTRLDGVCGYLRAVVQLEFGENVA